MNFQKLLDLVTAETNDTGMTRRKQNVSHSIGVSVAFALSYEKLPYINIYIHIYIYNLNITDRRMSW